MTYSCELTFYRRLEPLHEHHYERLILSWGTDGDINVDYRRGEDEPIYASRTFKALLQQLRSQAAVYSDELNFVFDLTRNECDMIVGWLAFCHANFSGKEMYG